MKLYYSPGACSLSPHIALHEAGLDFTPVRASTKTHQLDDGTDFYSINPLGYVPVLELDSGERLREGPAIVQYIADQVPDRKLAPPNGTLARYQLQGWLNFIASEVHKSFSPLFNPATPAQYKKMCQDKLGQRLQWINDQLHDGAFLMGEQFTEADGYLFTTTTWAKPMGVDLSHLDKLGAYRQRIGKRPAVIAAMKAEGLIR